MKTLLVTALFLAVLLTACGREELSSTPHQAVRGFHLSAVRLRCLAIAQADYEAAKARCLKLDSRILQTLCLNQAENLYKAAVYVCLRPPT